MLRLPLQRLLTLPTKVLPLSPKVKPVRLTPKRLLRSKPPHLLKPHPQTSPRQKQHRQKKSLKTFGVRAGISAPNGKTVRASAPREIAHCVRIIAVATADVIAVRRAKRRLLPLLQRLTLANQRLPQK